MSRCPYCHRELPGLETLCQQCFEKGYEQVAHPRPWWQRHRPRLTLHSLYAFLFVFAYGYIVFGISRDHHPTMTGLVLFASILAGFIVLIDFSTKDSGEPKVGRRTLYGFFILFMYFLVRLWAYSSYHPMKNPALLALVLASIAAIVESTREDSRKDSKQKKKAPEDSPAPLQRYDSRDAL
jgi:hypothetical protein